jgi:hypothetical protein
MKNMNEGVLPALAKPGAPDLRAATLRELREATAGLTPAQARAIWAHALDMEGLDEEEAALLTVCQRVLREERSLQTPVEYFIWKLLLDVQAYPPTLEDVRSEMADLEFNWNDALETARTFYVDHRRLVIAPEFDEEGDDDGKEEQ